jgi:hypothetical protein
MQQDAFLQKCKNDRRKIPVIQPLGYRRRSIWRKKFVHGSFLRFETNVIRKF